MPHVIVKRGAGRTEEQKARAGSGMKLITVTTLMLLLAGSAAGHTQTDQPKTATSAVAPEQGSRTIQAKQTGPEQAITRTAPDGLAANHRVFEIRIYTVAAEMDVFKKFFIDNTVALFRKYGFEPVGYWVPLDPPRSENTFVYILAFPDRETAKARWDSFLNDPAWIKARAEFIAQHGKITERIDSLFVSPLDFSPLK